MTIVDPERGATYDGAVVVIDVVRAFTTAATAFARGAREIHCVESIDRAYARRGELPGSLLIGEERGLPPEGFDLGNSPCQFDDVDLDDRVLVHRTSNGTRGLAWVDAPLVLAAAAVNAAATARLAAGRPPVTIIPTDARTSEDLACAEHLAAVLRGEQPDPDALRRRILASDDEHRAFWERPRSGADIAGHEADIAACAEVDRYDLAMVGRRDGDVIVLSPVRPSRGLVGENLGHGGRTDACGAHG